MEILAAILLAIALVTGYALRRRFILPLSRLRYVLQRPEKNSRSTLDSAVEEIKALRHRNRQAEQDLALWQAILEGTHDGILVVGADLRILSANRAAARLFGTHAPELEGRRLTEVTREKQLYDGFRAAVEQNTPFDGKIEIVQGIERKIFQLRIDPIGPNRAAGVFLDVTRLERLERVRQEFLSNVSHELRTPLTSILAYVETLLDGAIHDPDNNVRFLEIIYKHTRRLSTLVEDVSDLSAIESGEVRLQPEDVNLQEAVAEVAETLSPRAEQTGVRLLTDIPPGLTIVADRQRFEQILLNLMDNAIKFNRPGGQVIVQAQAKDGAVAISVEDTGIGIPPSDLPHVFERFYRADRARSMEMGGTGLGLAIVKHLVRLHGAHVSVESAPGRGSCFTLTWPGEWRSKEEPVPSSDE
jgi:two-component system phosphate regulon sensor histidine kinase PhoR